MIKLSAEIYVPLKSAISDVDIKFNNETATKNNISKGDITEQIYVSKEPFLLNVHNLQNNLMLCSGVDYFIGGEITSSVATDNGYEFSSEYVITLSGRDIKRATIVFDEATNCYPPYLIVDNERVEVNNANTIINFKQSEDNHIIKILSLNKPNYPLIIQGVVSATKIDIGKNELLSLDYVETDRGDYNLPSYGIISTTGNLSFMDRRGIVKELAEELLLTSQSFINIYLENTLKKTKTRVARFYVEKWNYGGNSKICTVTLKDDLQEWQEINIEGLYVSPVEENVAANFKYIYNYLYSKTPSKYNMLSFDELDSDTQYVLENSFCPYPMLNEDNLFSQYNKLCNVCCLHIYKKNGKTVCYYGGGN